MVARLNLPQMARAPREPLAPVPPLPQLVRLRVTEPEADVLLRALRSTADGAAGARRLADVLQHEVVLTGASAPRRATTRRERNG